MAWMNKTVLQNVPVKIHVINKKDYGANILAFLTSPYDISTNLQGYVWTFYKHHVFQCGQNVISAGDELMKIILAAYFIAKTCWADQVPFQPVILDPDNI